MMLNSENSLKLTFPRFFRGPFVYLRWKRSKPKKTSRKETKLPLGWQQRCLIILRRQAQWSQRKISKQVLETAYRTFPLGKRRGKESSKRSKRDPLLRRTRAEKRGEKPVTETTHPRSSSLLE